MKINYFVEDDNGNSEKKITINGEMLKFPNTYSYVYKEPVPMEKKIEELVYGLFHNMDVTVNSSALKGQVAQRVFVGERAIRSGADLQNLNIRSNRGKHKQDTTIMTTVSAIACRAVQDMFKNEGSLEEGANIEANISMVTALPASEWNKEKAKELSERFTNSSHHVTVTVGDVRIYVTLKFEKVIVVQEGTVALFALIEDGKGNYRNDDLFDEFKEMYDMKEITGEYFSEKRLLHIDIGDGTTEYVVTKGYDYDNDHSSGERHGIGHAIERAKKDFEDEWGFSVERQEFAGYLKEEHPKYYEDAKKFLARAKFNLADEVLDTAETKLQDLKYDVDVVVVYGGGSIQLKENLFEELKEICDSKKIKILWINPKNATEMNVKGMTVFSSIALQTEQVN
ncbi:ParM/StbA family protein [Bacillus sp. Xin]|uniref:ParM/StbA family protein n=1 Tax=unclassified Bacillus (in: firmicutes) TaxID=185979 RepID=UPI001574EB6C|nr:MULTISPECIES: ParM/StbA family protein [unclassified Bacillus (in: firmicutes)]MBC6971854.1 ParM/StbA family protein [Bacillus sp. Xin]NSW39317.1 ParM/StbA family protein [Bacillus sp. Xin1]